MKRKSGVILLGILIELLLILASFSYLYYQTGNTFHNLTEESIRGTFSVFFEVSSIGQKIFASLQGILLIVVLIAIFIASKKVGETTNIINKDYIIRKNEKRSRTDLDVLYEILQTKKEVNMEFIKEVFKITPKVALSWSKILEDGNLAEINYPRFGDPILRIIDNTPKQNKINYSKENDTKEKEKSDQSNNFKHRLTKRILIENIKDWFNKLHKKLSGTKQYGNNY